MPELEPNFILRNETARRIYEEGLRGLNIIDIHTHVDGTNRELPDNAWDLLAGGDHYKTQQMYLIGTPVSEIDDDGATKEEKWMRFSSLFPRTLGTVVYDATMLTLRRVFDLRESLNKDTAKVVWKMVNDYLTSGEVTLASIINPPKDDKFAGKIEVMATCDNPWIPDPYAIQTEIKDSHNPFRLGMRVEPLAFPGRFVQIGKDNDPISGLEGLFNTSISDVNDYLHLFHKSVERFAEAGNTSLDFSLTGNPQVYPIKKERATEILERAREGKGVSEKDQQDFLSYMIPVFFEEAYAQGIPLQLKIDVVREVNPYAPRNAHDAVDEKIGLSGLVPIILDYEKKANDEGKDWVLAITVRNRNNYQQLTDLASKFRILYWSGVWWDNDNVEGMEEGLKRASWFGLFRGIPFFSDTRSFTDGAARFDIMKRVLANYLAELVDYRNVPIQQAIRVGINFMYDHPKRLFNV